MTTVMTQKELIDTIHNELQVTGTPISKSHVAAVLERLAQVAIRKLTAECNVPLPGLGKLEQYWTAAYFGPNPDNRKETLEIPAYHRVNFVASKALESCLAGKVVPR
ncbi:MAG: HU family DNA-binding protein [Pseudomonas sp.]|nr:HU family DNA-binding protein [Pseudomonas sp.]